MLLEIQATSKNTQAKPKNIQAKSSLFVKISSEVENVEKGPGKIMGLCWKFERSEEKTAYR